MTMTPEHWDESFESVSSFITPGYMAILQKQLTVKGDCLLTAGGGAFQRTAREMYHKIHYYGRCVEINCS